VVVPIYYVGSSCAAEKVILHQNNRKIESINKNLEAHKKNPNFYRNKNIIMVAAAILAIAAVALITYFSWGIALPLALKAIGTGHASGMAIGGAIALPFMAGGLGAAGIANLFKSEKCDRLALARLTADNDKIKAKIQERVQLFEERISLCNEATAEQYSEKAWQAMIKLPIYTSLDSLKELNSPEKKKAAWLNYQPEIIAFRKRNESMKEKWQAVIKP